jgi:DNA repair and recombination protein RAD52
MGFTPEQIKALQAPLDRSAVKSRTQGGSQVSYIEAYHAENEANRIFGFDAWDRETTLTHIGEREQDGKWRVYYRAKVRITVRSGDDVTIREGNGYGSGIDRDIGQAHESALKEAESDAEKRALKTFGNPFGQALYDKTHSNVAETPPATITDDQRDVIAGLSAASGMSMQFICESYKIKDIRDLPAKSFDALVKRLKQVIEDNKKEAA